MTEQIKSAIEELEFDMECGEFYNPSMADSVKLAIRSLQAWEEVLQELENLDVDEYLKDEGHRFGFNEGICYVLELINQKLEEIKEGE